MGNSERLYFWGERGLQNHCRWWLQPWNSKALPPWKKNYDQPIQHIEKQRHCFANKGPSSQSSEKAMAPHSSTLAWKIPWTEEPGRLQFMGSWRVRHDWGTSLSLHFHALEKEMATHSIVLAWRIPGTEEPRGLPSMGSHRVGHDWSDLAAFNLYVCIIYITIINI